MGTSAYAEGQESLGFCLVFKMSKFHDVVNHIPDSKKVGTLCAWILPRGRKVLYIISNNNFKFGLIRFVDAATDCVYWQRFSWAHVGISFTHSCQFLIQKTCMSCLFLLLCCVTAANLFLKAICKVLWVASNAKCGWKEEMGYSFPRRCRIQRSNFFSLKQIPQNP